METKYGLSNLVTDQLCQTRTVCKAKFKPSAYAFVFYVVTTTRGIWVSRGARILLTIASLKGPKSIVISSYHCLHGDEIPLQIIYKVMLVHTSTQVFAMQSTRHVCYLW